MKSLEQIQEENRKAIIMAANPEAKSYKQALRMELGIGCEASYNYDDKDIKIIGKPLTLDRVLLLFKRKSLQRFHEFTYYDEFKLKDSDHIYKNSFQIWVKNKNFKVIAVFNWELTKPTLEMQSEEVQRSINKILMGNEQR